MTIQEIYDSLSAALYADKSPATEAALEALNNLTNVFAPLVKMVNDGFYIKLSTGELGTICSKTITVEQALAACQVLGIEPSDAVYRLSKKEK